MKRSRQESSSVETSGFLFAAPPEETQEENNAEAPDLFEATQERVAEEKKTTKRARKESK